MFKKGNTYGSKSTRQGIANKQTNEVRAAFNLLVENSLPQLEKDLKSLEPKDRLQIVINLSKFILPQLKAIDVTTDIPGETLLPETLNKLLNVPEEKYNEVYGKD